MLDGWSTGASGVPETLQNMPHERFLRLEVVVRRYTASTSAIYR